MAIKRISNSRKADEPACRIRGLRFAQFADVLSDAPQDTGWIDNHEITAASSASRA
jgi:hypothetical protein